MQNKMGDTPNLEDSFEETIEKLLTEIAKSEGIRHYKFEKGDGSVKGDGYMGIIKTAKIIDKVSNKVINLVVKSASKSDALRNQVSVGDLFGREIYMYDLVFPTFKTLQQEKGLAARNFTPRYYNSVKEYKFETLILENLKEVGYKLYERRIPMNEDHINLVLNEYGRLHALSFALRDQNPDTFEMVVGSMKDNFAKNVLKSGFIKNFISQCTEAQKVLEKNENKETLDVYRKFIDTIQQFFEALLHNPLDKYSVALHGDCWTNNMMFKYEDEENPAKPTQVRFLDFQTSRLGSPVLDLSYFIYTCCPKNVIDNLNNYLLIYYTSLCDYLTQLGSDPAKMFSFSTLYDHWKRYSRYGLILSLLVIHIMLTEKEDAIDLATVSDERNSIAMAFDYKISNFDQYKERVRPIILHFVKNKFI